MYYFWTDLLLDFNKDRHRRGDLPGHAKDKRSLCAITCCHGDGLAWKAEASDVSHDKRRLG